MLSGAVDYMLGSVSSLFFVILPKLHLMYMCESIFFSKHSTSIQDRVQFSNHTPSVAPSCHPSQSPQIYSHSFLLLNMSVFNLTGVCWTVCCLTYTTCSTVRIHSFHKKYIFVYTAFTISYNRAVCWYISVDGCFFLGDK